MSLQKPPRPDRPSRIVVRMFFLVFLMAGLGLLIWTAVTNQRIDLTEDKTASSIELEDAAVVDGVRINVVTGAEGPLPVVILHDRDVAGSAILDDLAAEVGGRFTPVLIDLPGYGLSDRVPEEGEGHTVARLAEQVAAVISERYASRVVLAGVGMGGEVAAEVAAANPDLVRGLVLIDVDFWKESGWDVFAERLPVVGRALVFTLEAGGRLGVDRWAPHCDEGGWCPEADDLAARELASSIAGTTDTIRAHLRTLPASLVPADLAKITAPVAYVRSTRAPVPDESVDRILEKIPTMSIFESDVWQAHLETPDIVVRAIEAVGQ